MKILVSACLLGENCKYNGQNNYSAKMADCLAGREVIPICPEMLAGLGAPRNCAEMVSGRVMDDLGNDVDEKFRRGVALAIEKIQDEPIEFAVLQPRSPTCGVHQIYDGTFSGTLIPGQGLLAAELVRRGIPVFEPDELPAPSLGN